MINSPENGFKIALIEDCHEVGKIIAESLIPHQVTRFEGLAQTRSALESEKYDLFLIDATLPDGDGFLLLNQLAHDPRYQETPLVMLTARSSIADKLMGLGNGADDYITKPFHPLELKARVNLLFKRKKAVTTEVLNFSDFEFHLNFQKCFLVAAEKIDLQLTPTEFRLFLALARHAGQVVTRRELKKEVWGPNGVAVEARGINTHITHLRGKLGERAGCIVAVYGKGYTFVGSEAES